MFHKTFELLRYLNFLLVWSAIFALEIWRVFKINFNREQSHSKFFFEDNCKKYSEVQSGTILLLRWRLSVKMFFYSRNEKKITLKRFTVPYPAHWEQSFEKQLMEIGRILVCSVWNFTVAIAWLLVSNSQFGNDFIGTSIRYKVTKSV